MNRLLELLLNLIVGPEEKVWYRLDLITQTKLRDRLEIDVEFGVDAVCADNPYDALLLGGQRNAMKPNQLLRAHYCHTRQEEERAIAINREHAERTQEFEQWMRL